MKRFIVMTSGYAEEATTAPLIYQCQFEEGYVSIKEAITDLALDLYAKFDEAICQPRPKITTCCQGTLKKHKKAQFCMQCGRRLTPQAFYPEEFMQFVKELHYSTCDTYGEADGTADRKFEWQPYFFSEFIGAPKEEIIYIANQAEKVLMGALVDAKPELLPKEERQYWVDETTDWSQFRKELLPEYD